MSAGPGGRTAGPPRSTYRLQVYADFDLYAVADLCGYLAVLGADALYLSPLLPAVTSSEHGYDVVGHDGIDASRGGVDGWARLLSAVHDSGLQLVVDIVPNHVGVADAFQNPAWWDVLRLGAESPFAAWFDIDWASPSPGGYALTAGGTPIGYARVGGGTPTGRVLLPVLGDDFDPSQLRVVDAELRYHEHRFPLAPGTGPAAGEAATAVHRRQHYELVGFRRADTEQNYRRFFAVTTLAGLRVEDADVFEATHRQIVRWVHADGISGLRVDHPDGLADPLGYLRRLRAVAGEHSWITVEKILEPGEALPADWPVDGTTGYDALAEVQALFIDPGGEARLDACYRERTGDDASFAEHAARGKREVADTILQAEVARLAALIPGVAEARAALVELLVAFPVYRSYLPTGAEHLAAAIDAARVARPDLAGTIDVLAARLATSSDELCVRFQQLSGAVMAKGVEDTAYYRYTRFVALNEVGGDPGRFGSTVEEFHATQRRRQTAWSASMTTLSTHDTKRGEDVRARLAVLSELPGEWAALIRRLMAAAPLAEPTFAYLLWQTFTGSGGPPADRTGGAPSGGVAGGGFIDRRRMHAYAEKAMREASLATNWIDPATEFEAQVHALVDRAYDDPAIRGPLAAFVDRITPYGWTNSLSQKLIQLTMPGVPDVYQGNELWDDSLVDPDNRRPVDFAIRRTMLAELDRDGNPPPIDASGRAKLWVLSRALRLRRDRPELFGDYRAILASGSAPGHVVAFDRGGAITVATRLPVGLERDGGWRDTVLSLDGGAVDVLSGRRHSGEVRLTELLADYPVALLTR